MSSYPSRSGNPTAARTSGRSFATRSLSSLLPHITRPVLRRQLKSAAQLALDWGQIVGPEHAACTTPSRLSAGTLTLSCAGPVAMELQYLSPVIIQRINTYFGEDTVKRLKFIPADPSSMPPPRRAARAAPEPVAIADMPDGPLKEALARLGGHIKRR